jgi:hypothetical protein
MSEKHLADLSEFRKEDSPDDEVGQARSLFEKLKGMYTEPVVLAYIEHHTENVPELVSEWVNGTRKPSRGIRKRILRCLQEFDPAFIPAVKIAKPNEIPEPQAEIGHSEPAVELTQGMEAVESPSSPSPEQATPQPAKPKQDRLKIKDLLRDLKRHDREIYFSMLDHNPVGESIDFSDLSFPGFLSYERKNKLVGLLCIAGLMRDDGSNRFTILQPKTDYQTKAQNPPAAPETVLPKSPDHQAKEDESIRRLREYMAQQGAILPEEKK